MNCLRFSAEHETVYDETGQKKQKNFARKLFKCAKNKNVNSEDENCKNFFTLDLIQILNFVCNIESSKVCKDA